MDIKILDSWLRDYLKTKATPKQIGEYLSLCGPSVERIHKQGRDVIYDIEVTTNRVDCVSYYGIAREASAILPRFKISATLKNLVSIYDIEKTSGSLPLSVITIPETKRVMAVVIDDVSAKESPGWLKKRLELSGLRSLNLLIDITNYVMLETGHPTHVFDYDRIQSHRLVFRKSKAGESIITLDNKVHSLLGEDIVIDDGNGEIIDLPGIMGTANSVVTYETKRIIFFIDSIDPFHIRKTSMSTGIRTDAATSNEKGPDPEVASLAFARGIELYTTVAQGKIASELIDIYPKSYKEKKIDLNLSSINRRLGITLIKKDITSILESLGFSVEWNSDDITVSVPSWRAQDIEIPEDIVEEVARIYGYHNLPSNLMPGIIPEPLQNASFDFEIKVKNILKGFGGVEVYTYSFVAKDKVDIKGESSWVLKLKNPLGLDSEYMRLSLAPSLVSAVKNNSGVKETIHLFEVANVYLPTRGELPEERMTLGCISLNSSWEETKGIVEGLLKELNIDYDIEISDGRGFAKQQRLQYKAGKEVVGTFGKLEDCGLLYFEFDMPLLKKYSKPVAQFKPLPKYPAQIEDLTLSWPSKTYLGEVIKLIRGCDKQIVSVEYVGLFENSKTFRLAYQNNDKTLTDREVEIIRKCVLEKLNKKFGIKLKA